MKRRDLLIGIGTLFAAPAIVRAGSLMPVRSIIERVPLGVDTIYVDGEAWLPGSGSMVRPFTTLQQAFDSISDKNLDFNGQSITIQMASGVYQGGIYRGSNDLVILGTPEVQTQIMGSENERRS